MLRMNRGFHDYCRFYERRMLTFLSSSKAAKSRADNSDREQRMVAHDMILDSCPLFTCPPYGRL